MTSVSDFRRDDPAWLYLACFVVIGLALGLAGPSVGALRDQVGVGTSAIGKVFAAQGAGYLLGSQVAGRLYDRGGGHRVVRLGITGLALAFAAVPAASSLLALAGLFVVVGFCAASIDVGCNAMLVWSRGAGAGRVLGALHLCFGLGALVAPVLSWASIGLGDDLWLACLLVGAAGLTVAIGSARFVAPERPVRAPTTELRRSASQRASVLVVASAAVWFLLYVGVEVGFTSWIHTYGEEIELGSDAEVTALNSSVWIAFTLGRILAVVAAGRSGPLRVLAMSALVTTVAAISLLVGDGRPSIVWPAVVLYGLAVGPQFPMMMAYVGRSIDLSARSTSVFVGAAGVSSLIIPWMLGSSIDRSGARALPVGVTILTSAALAALYVVHRFITASATRRAGGSSNHERRRDNMVNGPLAPTIDPLQ